MDAVSESETESETTARGETAFERKQLGDAAGGEDLGCSLYVVPPGKRSWPAHYHTANEEAIYVLDGRGEVRGPDDERLDLTAGTYAAFPTGPGGTHRIHNTGEEPLRYLAVSTMVEPDVLVYPESEKIGVMAGEPPGGATAERLVSDFFRAEDAVDYWEDEP